LGQEFSNFYVRIPKVKSGPQNFLGNLERRAGFEILTMKSTNLRLDAKTQDGIGE
jgi:hypothetical protein